MTKKFWKTPKFKKLKTEWEEKLKKSGFIDIEDESGRLKQNAGNSYRTTEASTIEGKQRYYELLCQGYYQERGFRDTVEKTVMLLRSRGMKIQAICEGLEIVRERCGYATIRKIIKNYEVKWQIKKKMAEQENKTDLGIVQIFAYTPQQLPERYLIFVKDRWLKTYKKCSKVMKLVDPESYHGAYPGYIHAILSRRNVTVRVALLKDADALLGFSVSQGSKLHYVNVPLDYRGQGIARKLVPFNVESFTHLTETGASLWTNKFPKARFDLFDVGI